MAMLHAVAEELQTTCPVNSVNAAKSVILVSQPMTCQLSLDPTILFQNFYLISTSVLPPVWGFLSRFLASLCRLTVSMHTCLIPGIWWFGKSFPCEQWRALRVLQSPSESKPSFPCIHVPGQDWGSAACLIGAAQSRAPAAKVHQA